MRLLISGSQVRALVRLPKKIFGFQLLRQMSVETKTSIVRRFLWLGVARPDCCATFPSLLHLLLCFRAFTPFDSARGSDGTGRLCARRRIGYWSEQNGLSQYRWAPCWATQVLVSLPFARSAEQPQQSLVPEYDRAR